MSLSPAASITQAGKDDYMIEGIRVERYKRAVPGPSVPLICVHGGGQASWCWDDFAPVLQQGGFEVHTLNWLGRNGSAAADPEWFLNASIADVVRDISVVAAQFEQPPVLIGHSMGGLACQLYAQDFPVKALLLLTPVVPCQVNTPIIDLPIDNSTTWGPLPLAMAKELFFQGLDDTQCAHFYPMLVPESPRRCYEATRWTLSVQPERISMPTLIISGALDALTPASTGQKLAELYGAEHRLEVDLGHNVLLGQRGRDVAKSVIPWLASHIAEAPQAEA